MFERSGFTGINVLSTTHVETQRSLTNLPGVVKFKKMKSGMRLKVWYNAVKMNARVCVN
jgi:hypothetical protein